MTASTTPALRVLRADYANPIHARDLLALLDAYARELAGGGTPLSAYARAHLVRALAARSDTFSVLAYDGGAPPLHPRGLRAVRARPDDGGGRVPA